jgi:hypothetical protein
MYTNSRRPSRTADTRWRSTLIVAIASLAFPTVVLRAGEVYKFVDAQGHVVYSDQAQGDTSAAQQSVGTAVSNPSADVEASEAPPALPSYEQPPCPEEGYLWTPGYWAWSAAGYYWMPGVWVQPPRVGVLWTPGYWGYVGAVYVFRPGYWAPHIGYYGGINYGFGYFGVGFAGGRWVGNSFAYNRTVSNVDERAFHNTYNEAVHSTLNRVSYNGGPGGTTFAPTAQERAFAAESRIPPTQVQRQNMVQAARIPALMPHTSVRVNQPAPSTDHRITAPLQKPAVFNPPAAVTAHDTAAPTRTIQNSVARAAPSPNVAHQIPIAHPSAPTPAHAAQTKPRPPLH